VTHRLTDIEYECAVGKLDDSARFFRNYVRLTMLKSSVFCVVITACIPLCGGAEQRFPKPRVSTTLLEGDWISSPIVAIGDVVNITSYGEQATDYLPRPTMQDVHRLYWCEGDFRVVAVVKGAFHELPKKYLWASTLPGCRLLPDNPEAVANRDQTRVWFLREERGLLRPTFDYGTYRFLGILTRWDNGPRLPPRQRLGTLLLTPAANGVSLEDYAAYIWQIGDIACDLLGKLECGRQIRNLAKLGNPVLEEAACGFLKGQLEQDCDTPNQH
jgi:hypothetical protein